MGYKVGQKEKTFLLSLQLQYVCMNIFYFYTAFDKNLNSQFAQIFSLASFCLSVVRKW